MPPLILILFDEDARACAALPLSSRIAERTILAASAALNAKGATDEARAITLCAAAIGQARDANAASAARYAAEGVAHGVRAIWPHALGRDLETEPSPRLATKAASVPLMRLWTDAVEAFEAAVSCCDGLTRSPSKPADGPHCAAILEVFCTADSLRFARLPGGVS